MDARLITKNLVETDRVDFWQDVVCRDLPGGECLAPRDRPFRGKIATRRLPDLSISRLRSVKQRYVRSQKHVGRIPHETLCLLLQLSGTGMVSQDDREVILKPGDFALTDSTRPAALGFDDDFDQLAIDIPRKAAMGLLGRTENLTARSGSATPMGPVLRSCLRHTAAVLDEVRPATSERLSGIALALIMATLDEMAGSERRGSSWTRTALLYRAKEFIDAHARDPALGPQTVAAALGITPRYLQMLFRDDGSTPSEWIWHRREEKSRQDLCNPALASQGIGSIALTCGFSDFAHFSHRFKAAYGMSPRQFRSERLRASR